MTNSPLRQQGSTTVAFSVLAIISTSAASKQIDNIARKHQGSEESVVSICSSRGISERRDRSNLKHQTGVDLFEVKIIDVLGAYLEGLRNVLKEK